MIYEGKRACKCPGKVCSISPAISASSSNTQMILPNGKAGWISQFPISYWLERGLFLYTITIYWMTEVSLQYFFLVLTIIFRIKKTSIDLGTNTSATNRSNANCSIIQVPQNNYEVIWSRLSEFSWHWKYCCWLDRNWFLLEQNVTASAHLLLPTQSSVFRAHSVRSVTAKRICPLGLH